MEHLAHLFTQFEGFEHLDAVAVFLQLIQEIDCGADVEREVRIMFRAGNLALGVMQRQRAQVVGHPVVGTDDDVGQSLLTSLCFSVSVFQLNIGLVKSQK